jgi:nitrate reductase gamma subunit
MVPHRQPRNADGRNPPQFTEWAYIGRNIATLEGALGAGATFYRYLWLTHVLIVHALLFCFPFTKLRHFVIAPVDLFFRNLNARGRLEPIKDEQQPSGSA